MWTVEDYLVVGVAVDCCDVALFDAEAVVEDFCHRSQAVCGAAGVAHAFDFVGEFVVVDADDDGSVDFLF